MGEISKGNINLLKEKETNEYKNNSIIITGVQVFLGNGGTPLLFV